MIRYLDFNDSYLAKGETCHPSDNLAAIPAAGEHIGATGRDLKERIRRVDVQALLGKVSVQSGASFSERFPKEMPCRIKITLKDGRVLEQETKDYEGSFTRPMSWEMALQKSNEITTPYSSAGQRTAIADAVANLEQVRFAS